MAGLEVGVGGFSCDMLGGGFGFWAGHRDFDRAMKSRAMSTCRRSTQVLTYLQPVLVMLLFAVAF